MTGEDPLVADALVVGARDQEKQVKKGNPARREDDGADDPGRHLLTRVAVHRSARRTHRPRRRARDDPARADAHRGTTRCMAWNQSGHGALPPYQHVVALGVALLVLRWKPSHHRVIPQAKGLSPQNQEDQYERHEPGTTVDVAAP